MTRTEERLADALATVARGMPDDSLPPLDTKAGVRPARRGRVRHTRWLVPLVAAAAVLLIVALAVVIPGGHSAGQFTDAGTGSAPPPFYVSVDVNDRILVHSTSTGKVTAETDEPSWFSGGNFADTAVAAGPSGPVFAVAVNDWNSDRTRIFTFSLTSAGQITNLAASTIRVPGLTSLSAALSPDGNELALAGVADGPCCNGVSGPPKLVVVNLRTGRVNTWTGPARSGSDDLTQDPSWSANGRALYFLITHCRGGRANAINAVCPYNWPAGQEWIAAAHSRTGSVTARPTPAVLPAGTSQAVAVPGPALIVLSVGSHARRLTISQYTIGGTLMRTLYTGRPDRGLEAAHLSVDSSGRYVILNEDRSAVLGWIRNGKLHKLSTRGPLGVDQLLSDAW